jgi:hypothetical protein
MIQFEKRKIKNDKHGEEFYEKNQKLCSGVRQMKINLVKENE